MIATQETRVAPANVVVADVDSYTRDMLTDMLRSRGHTVHSCDTGTRALDRVRAGGIDLALLDIMMPELTGLDVCRAIKEGEGPFVPVVLLTARADTDSRVEGLRLGADDYVAKPFDERELMARIDGMLRIKRLHDEVWEAKTRLEHLSVRDALTGLYNYRFLNTRLIEEFKRAERYKDPLACAMIDIDNFKEFNETHGHAVGDAVLKEVGNRLHASVREIDVVARYGGEEFLLVLPSTHFSGAVTVAERVWRKIGENPIEVAGREHNITISLGVSVFPGRDVGSKDDLLKASERALTQAKNDGRNAVCVYHHSGYMFRPRRGDD